MKLLDLSIFLENDVPSDPPIYRPHIEYLDHRDTLPDLLSFFPGLAPEELPDEEAWALERVSLTTHNGTHLDAPYHYASTMDGGRPAATIDEIPLNWCMQPAIKLDFRHFADGYVATAADVADELERIGHTLSPLEIVLINTRAGERYGHDDYVRSGCGMSREATLYLLEQGVRVTGTDAWSWDAPFVYTNERYQRSKDAGIIWEGHRAGREVGYCHLEKLHNLEQLPATGFTVVCFPVKVRGASAGWTRAVALIDGPVPCPRSSG